MSRSTLKFLAALLAVLMVIIAFAGLDGLPRSLKAQIDSERKALASVQTQFRNAQDEVLRELRTEADLFRGVASSTRWPDQLSQSFGDLQKASRQMDELTALQKQNRKSDRQKAERLLAQEHALRAAAMGSTETIQKDAAHWVDLKNHLPEAVAEMDRNYRAIHAYDLSALANAIQKAETDWPEKRADLEARLSKLRLEVTESDAAWQASAEERRMASGGDFARVNFGSLFAAVDTLKTAAADLPKKSTELQALPAQLYDSWDKLLVDMSEPNRQKLRIVRTHYPDAAAKTGEVSSDEKWVEVSREIYQAKKSELGMAIEHKAAGKYDMEAERVAQPAGFAYVAPPSQRSNQYGYWDHRDGRDFWVFYGQYALLRDLLWNHHYQPLDRYEWEGYRTARTGGQTYYGRDASAGQSAPKYGTSGTATQSGYSGSTFAKGGGFRDSKYATQSGSYRDSKYASPNARDPDADHSPKRFGNSSRPDERRASPPPRSSPSYRPSPAPRSSPSTGRRFGKR